MAGDGNIKCYLQQEHCFSKVSNAVMQRLCGSGSFKTFTQLPETKLINLTGNLHSAFTGFKELMFMNSEMHC